MRLFPIVTIRLEDKYSENRTIGINLQNSTKMTSWLTLDVGYIFELWERYYAVI